MAFVSSEFKILVLVIMASIISVPAISLITISPIALLSKPLLSVIPDSIKAFPEKETIPALVVIGRESTNSIEVLFAASILLGEKSSASILLELSIAITNE